MEHNIYRWAANVLGALREIRLQDSTTGDAIPPAPFVTRPQEPAQRKLA